jgi:hypothetical protein
LSKVFDVSTIGSPVNSLALQTPHLASEAGRSAGTRLTAEQWGQTAWSDSVMAAPSLAAAGYLASMGGVSSHKHLIIYVCSRIRDRTPR